MRGREKSARVKARGAKSAIVNMQKHKKALTVVKPPGDNRPAVIVPKPMEPVSKTKLLWPDRFIFNSVYNLPIIS